MKSTAAVAMALGLVLSCATRDVSARRGAGSQARAIEALDALEAHAQSKRKLTAEQAKQAATTVLRAASRLPRDEKALRSRLATLRAGYADAWPGAKRPLGPRHALQRMLLTLQLTELRKAPPEQTPAHPAAAEFPGAVDPKAKRVSRTVRIDTARWGWHSTGLYAAPGEAIAVTVPAAAADKRLALRIGAHKDSLWHLSSWRRCPEICRTWPIRSSTTRGASAFGGPVYIEVPPKCPLKTIPVTISGAVPAPLYVLGETSLASWRKTLRTAPAPWAELAGRRVVLTVPSRAVRTLDDPETLMTFWDAVLDACADLAAWPRERTRLERFVTDVQISAGYMHSGYPLMTHLDMPDVMVSKQRLLSNRHGGIWGLFHEAGHNHQSRDWTFSGTVEVTVNLFTLYVYETVCGRTAVQARPGVFSPRAQTKKIKAYLATGRDFRKWQRDPFLALLMYAQLRDAFGWEAYKKVFAEYRKLPRDQRPRTDDQRRDQWMVRFSRAVGRNLGPFFQAWGVPTSKQARQSIANLPTWMPKNFPPK